MRSPTTTGKIERFHQSLRREFLDGRIFASLEAGAGRARCLGHRLQHRPAAPGAGDGHARRALPADAARHGSTSRSRSMPAEDHAGQWVLRRVASNGVVSVDNQMFSVGNAYKAELVDVFVDETTIQVWSKNHLIKTVARTRSGPVRKIRADGLHVKHQPDTKRQASTITISRPLSTARFTVSPIESSSRCMWGRATSDNCSPRIAA